MRFAWGVIASGAALAAAAAFYTVTHFAITTDTNRLMPPSLPWVKQEHAYQALFPPKRILAVIDAPTPELADDAAYRLVSRLKDDHQAIKSIEQPQADSFLVRASLLFQPLNQVRTTTAELIQARPVLAQLSADPTLRGIMQALAGVARQPPKSGRPAALLSDTLEAALSGHYASFSWLSLLQGHDPSAAEREQLLPVDPALNFGALKPGKAAEDSLRAAANAADLQRLDGASLRLTGEAAINDDQFATLSNGAALNGVGTAFAVLLILILALRSRRLVLAVVLNLVAGLLATAAVGLLLVGAFNLISVAFAVLFVGLGADFGIQFGVRFRAERHDLGDIRPALRNAAIKAGGALALAAAGVAAGFFSFVPTDYRGIAELGEIAGTGMVIAFGLTLTLLPALIAVLKPSGEPASLDYHFLAPVDAFLSRHRIAVVVCTILTVLAGTPLLAKLRFDFDPMHLQDPNAEAVATYRALGTNPANGVAAVDVALPSLEAARDMATRLDALPDVQSTRTIDALIPKQQAPKLAAIVEAAKMLLPAMTPASTRPAPTDAENIAAIRDAARSLPAGADNDRLRGLLVKLADGDGAVRDKVAQALIRPLHMDLERLAEMLRAEPVSIAQIPSYLRIDWLRADHKARVEILPKGDPNNTSEMAAFARAVLDVAPAASGTAITLLQSGRTVVRAFVEAGLYAVAAIALILLVTLRRIGDVLLTLVPLLVAAAITLEVTVLTGQPLNFANIIALPLLLGVGVAFKIYYILAWRRGATQLLQSTLTRAVFFSALTTMTAFGSLWLSNDPGMSSMGKLMALALVCTLLAAVLFQPALMGPPRGKT